MNYAQARRRDDDSGFWDWTTMNDKKIHHSRPCTQACQHTSADEACRHFYEYCLERATVHETPGEQYKCVICGAWTSKSLGNNQMSLAIKPFSLCEQHLNKESLASACPFEGAVEIIHS